ncbi:uncharacterized protein BO87DRAFT_236256 [Aspergillus neoniger CBS 115656]|uniref:Uncharacterized protein n=1 Tax=Aspergillus neoniger (strain CBS 115656) TaxID=1448310 RepID=A0A318YWM2_ASPNB|nr:hypothetical protein BO87DRAFT_236256 [Aspergillus neoniger CBS 115656]PYH36270.1 hypothetical protein BO87DRAFT_236256 [Aspergillus neoniger CBS 115656]
MIVTFLNCITLRSRIYSLLISILTGWIKDVVPLNLNCSDVCQMLDAEDYLHCSSNVCIPALPTLSARPESLTFHTGLVRIMPGNGDEKVRCDAEPKMAS